MGIPVEDIGLVVTFFTACTILYNILNLWLAVPKHFLLATALLSLALLAVLKRANKRRQPGFLASWLAFRLKTPKHIYCHKTIYFFTNDLKNDQKKGQKG